MWWSDGRRGRKLDELVEKARTEKVPIDSFDPEAMERRTPYEECGDSWWSEEESEFRSKGLTIFGLPRPCLSR